MILVRVMPVLKENFYLKWGRLYKLRGVGEGFFRTSLFSSIKSLE